MSASKTAVPGRGFKTSLAYSVPIRRLKEILRYVVPDLTLGSVDDLPSTQLPRLYTLNMSDDTKLMLSFAPSLTVRLLRHETTLQYSEAILIHFLDTSIRKNEASDHGIDSENEGSINLKDVVPKILKYSSDNREMAYPYTIFEETPGKAVSAVSIYLSTPERQLIDKQVGSLTRTLASLTSPSGKFGTVARVLPNPFKPPSAPLDDESSPTWSGAFSTLLESVLRDGEDMAVLLPYDVVRSHYQRLSWRLDAIRLPRLVILDLGDKNVMIENGIKGENSGVPTKSLKLVGLRNWSQGLFGDPLLSSVFENPSEGFLEGWRRADGDHGMIEDTTNAEVRLLLYRCYRAVVGIVTEYYRPQPDSSRKELENRRNLTNTLADLEKVDIAVNEALKRARSLSSSVAAEPEGSKRQKLDDDEKMKLTSVLNL